MCCVYHQSSYYIFRLSQQIRCQGRKILRRMVKHSITGKNKNLYVYIIMFYNNVYACCMCIIVIRQSRVGRPLEIRLFFFCFYVIRFSNSYRRCAGRPGHIYIYICITRPSLNITTGPGSPPHLHRAIFTRPGLKKKTVQYYI